MPALNPKRNEKRKKKKKGGGQGQDNSRRRMACILRVRPHPPCLDAV